MILLKRLLPFALTLTVGIIIGGIVWRHKLDASYERLAKEIKADKVYKIANSSEPSFTIPTTEVDSKAVILSTPVPAFTQEARLHETTGVVRMRVLLASSGEVANIQTLSTLPDGLTESAIEAAKKNEFYPAMKDRHSVSQWVTIEYNFNLY